MTPAGWLDQHRQSASGASPVPAPSPMAVSGDAWLPPSAIIDGTTRHVVPPGIGDSGEGGASGWREGERRLGSAHARGSINRCPLLVRRQGAIGVQL